ncbi:hypothetical protein PUN28_006714 [Cardiocondyla obscurior]|uniref:Uncharacterized protein n=1 Tax=Cardiocondyla obscurior TaxID=286306 RepID=A0AAW2G1E6_9HYME
MINKENTVCFTAILAAPADKQKRDILPGDPRYGTEHHHHHHEHQEHQDRHEHENEVQISKAAGGYVGSFTVPDDTEDQSFQVPPQSSYGPPSHTPGKPLGTDFLALSEIDKTPASLLVPSTSYGIPDTTQLLNGNYIAPVADEKKPIVLKEQLKSDAVNVHKSLNGVPEAHHEVHQPAILQKHLVENIPQTVSLPQAKVTASQVPTQFQGAFHTFPSYSYSSYSNIPVKTIDRHVHVNVPQPYHVPVTKHVAVPVPVPHTVEVPKPYYVRVPQPVQVTVDRPYPVEVPRPVPYPVHHYVKTNVPVVQSVAVDTLKANPLQTFFENGQTTFQNVFANVPSFPSLEGFQNPFENLDLSSFPFIPSSLPSFIPQQIQGQVPSTPERVNAYPSSSLSSNSDSVTVDNASLKTDTSVSKPAIVRPVSIHTAPQGKKPSTACAGCTVTSASSKQEYVQSVDANGGYVY